MTALLAPRNPNRVIRKPTGIAPWPRILLAGPEKTGKTWEAITTSNSDMIGRTFFIEIGEDSGDEYASVGKHEVVEHDGSYADILDAVRTAVAQPRDESGRPNLIIVDSVTLLWDLLCDEQTAAARRKAERNDRKVESDQDLVITAEQWNRAKERWRDVINTLRYHDGPVIYCARLEEVVVFDGDRPTKARMWKVKAEKNLPFDVTAVVHLRAYQSAFLTGVRSINRELCSMQTRQFPDFKVEKLLRYLGMEQRVPSPFTAPNPAGYLSEMDSENAVRSGSQGAAQQPHQAGPQLPAGRDLGNLIIAAYKADTATAEPASLNALRMHFGTLYLERQTVPGRGDAPVNANDAITKAINSLGGGQGGKVPEQGQPVPGEETRRCNRPGCETPHADVRRYASGMKCVNHNPEAEGAAVRAAARQEPSMSDADLLNALSSGFPEVEAGAAAILRGETEGFPDDAEDQGDEEELPPDGEDQPADADPWDEPLPPQTPALTGAEKARAILLNEAAGQAFHLGISRDKHLETLLPPGTQPDAVTPSRLRTFIVGQRVPVTKALRGKGQATMADAYASLGKDVTEDALRILAGEVDGN